MVFFSVNIGKSLSGQTGSNLFDSHCCRNRNIKKDVKTRIIKLCCPQSQSFVNGERSVSLDEFAALRAVEFGLSGKKEFQVIINFRHGAHG